jgi:hypothetical protein
MPAKEEIMPPKLSTTPAIVNESVVFLVMSLSVKGVILT